MMKYKLMTAALSLFLSTHATAQNAESQELRQLKDSVSQEKNKTIFQFNEEQSSNVRRHLRYSSITGYRREFSGIQPKIGSIKDIKQGTARMYMLNMTILEMLGLGYAEPLNKVVLEVKDRDKFIYDPSQKSKQEWLQKNSYCFDYVAPLGTITNVEIYKNEIAHYFGISFGYEMRMTDVLVLVRTSTKDKIMSKHKSQLQTRSGGILRNVPLRSIVQLAEEHGLPPILDETEYAGTVDMDLKLENITKLGEFRNDLKKYDLDLKPGKREMRVLVIHDNVNSK